MFAVFALATNSRSVYYQTEKTNIMKRYNKHVA